VPQHVGMDEEGKARRLARTSHHALISGHRKWRPTFRHEDIGAARAWSHQRLPAEGGAVRGFP
jgi:hypothetical protein